MKFLLNLRDILNQLVIIAIYLIYNLTYLVKEIIIFSPYLHELYKF